LPTEAEWEYSCRAGTTTVYSFGDSDELLDRFAVYSRLKAASCGQKLPNAFGLHDMHGNVWEWCGDWYARDAEYAGGDVTDPSGPSSGSYRVNRGGSWSYHPQNCRSALRNWRSPGNRNDYLGFRVLRSSIK